MSEETTYKTGKKPRENPNLVHKHLNTQKFLSFWVNKTEPGMVAHPLFRPLRRLRPADLWVQGQPAPQSRYQDSQGYKKKLSWKNQTKTKKHLRVEVSTSIYNPPAQEADAGRHPGGWQELQVTRYLK